MKAYANSLIGVGIASSLYHASRGKLRKYLRWVDYTMIATTTIVSSISSTLLLNPSPNPSSAYQTEVVNTGQCLSRALRNENPKLLMAASALALPFQPLMVSAVHTGMMEVLTYLKAQHFLTSCS